MPVSVSASWSGTPASAMVGTSGKPSTRWSASIASAEFPLLDLADGGRPRREADRRVAGDRRGDRRRRAGERNDGEVEPEGELEQLAGKMRRRADARLRKAVLGGTGLDQRDQLLDRLGRHLRVDREDVG